MILTERQRIQLSMMMTQALRHRPGQFNLTLDSAGWTPISDLAAALADRFAGVDPADAIAEVVALSDKTRYEIKDNRIRATYGHTVEADDSGQLTAPPAYLFHGTTPQALPHIRRTGLQPMKRRRVHLSATDDTATIVARRRTDKPIILKVRAAEAAQARVRFWVATDRTWTAEPIGPEFLEFPDQP
ncbi:RNA 2'-phosphotransferase [Ammonicoccus fulvus]|uniref:Probable RNA 2'-phosphotransferase n=1 Tax=Ammonicoccus fulvus TaxID=3138240 RepID=A0ABZ3FXG6_9ACTN